MAQPQKKRYISTALIGLLVILLISSLIKTPSAELKSIKLLLDKTEINYDESSLYAIEKRLTSFMNTKRENRLMDRAQNLMGRLEYIKALHTPSNLRQMYMENAVKHFSINMTRSTNFYAENLYGLGLSCYGLGENAYRDSEKALIDALRRGYPDRIKIIKLLNNIYLKNREFRIIIDLNQEFLKKRFYDAELLFGLAMAYRGSGELEKAEEIFFLIKNLRDKPSDALLCDIYSGLADCQYEQAKWLKAIENYDLFFRLTGPEHADYAQARFRYADSLATTGQADAALSVLEDMLKTGSTNKSARALYNKLKELKAQWQ